MPQSKRNKLSLFPLTIDSALKECGAIASVLLRQRDFKPPDMAVFLLNLGSPPFLLSVFVSPLCNSRRLIQQFESKF